MTLELALESVGYRYRGGHQAVADVGFTMAPGIVGLLGPNGAGKSTLMRVLSTLAKAGSGRVLWRGEDIARKPDVLRRELGYLPQDFGVYEALSAREFLAFLSAVKGLPSRTVKARVDECLVLVGAGLAVGLLAQWLRAEDLRIDLVELAKPVLVLTMPSLALTAALAVWFDLVPWLRRSAGNVLFFVVWTMLLSFGVSQAENSPGAALPWPGDPHGLLVAEYDLTRAWPAEAGKDLGLSVGSQALEGKAPVLLDWTQWQVTAETLRGRAVWLGLALVLLALAVPFLDRCSAHVGSPGKSHGDGARLRWLDAALAPLQRSAFGALVAAELRLVLRPRRAWWWLALLAAMGVQAFAPEKAMAIAIIVAWVLAMDVLARLVLREHETHTGALVFTAPGMRLRLLLVRAIVAIGLAWALTLPALLRLAMLHPQAALATLVTGLSLALWGMATGVLFRNGRMFELVVLAAAYVSVQGGLLLNVVVAPMTTLQWHLLALPLALAILAFGWRKLEPR